jgi:Zn-dependent peptidase ImmA (M78 family)/transcriptional regulator with XRE-family HTH domain
MNQEGGAAMEKGVDNPGDSRDVGRRLQEARKAARKTQQEASDFLGVARTTITAIEKGDRKVQPAELVRLAELYGHSVSDLLRRGSRSDAFSVQLRASLIQGPLAEGEFDGYVQAFERLCDDYVELEQLCGAPLVRRYPPPYQLSGVQPEAAAEDVATSERNRLGCGDGPIVNIRGIVESDVGARVFYMDLPSRISAMFAYAEEFGACIAVNLKHPEERRRWSLCHEYAHFLTNRSQPEVAVVGRYVRQPEHERFADAFAAAFLMPQSGLTRRFNQLKSGKGNITTADLFTLAHLYFVSLEALTVRLEDLRLLTIGTWERIRRVNAAEARDLLDLPEHPAADQYPLPSRYRYLAVEAHSSEPPVITEGELARFLRVDRIEARAIAEQLSHAPGLISDQGNAVYMPLDLGEPLTGRSA